MDSVLVILIVDIQDTLGMYGIAVGSACIE